MSKLKVLFLAADPLSADPGRSSGEQHSRLKIDDELRVIAARLRDAGAGGRVELVPWLAVRADDFLLALETERPHVVHFSGHGNKAGEIIVVGHDGGPRTIAGDALLDLFRTLKEEVRVVVFNACHTHLPAERISEVIDCTVGMSQSVTDEAALTFSASFYRAIGFGRSVQDAFNQGIVAMHLENLPERRSPRLSVRAGVDAARVTLVHPAHGRPWPAQATAGEPPPSAASVRESRNAYLDRVLAEHGTITLPAFGKERTLTRVSLDRLYVGLRGEITTRSQRLDAEQYAHALRTGEGFDEADWLATHSDLREARNAAEVLSTTAPLNLAQALEAVASLDFRLVILGSPGSGKSTISQWLALTMAAALREDRDALSLVRAGLFPEEADREGPPVVIPGTCLPVLIRVSRYAEFLLGQDGRQPPMDLLTYATEQVVNAAGPAHRATLRYYVDEMDWRGRLLVILDGLDELPDTRRAHHAPDAPRWQQRIRETVLEQVRLMAAAFRPVTDTGGLPLRRNALLVTSRIKGYDFNSLLPGELTHLTIEPMSGAERREFFRHWTRAVADGGQTAHDALREGAHRFCTDLSREVEADRRLRREVTTPQMAGLIASVALDSWQALSGGAPGSPARLGRLLPRSRTEIYGSVVELLLGRWTDDRYWGPGTRDEALAGLMSEPGQLLRVLKEVALAIHADRDLQSGDVDEPRLARIVLEAAGRLEIPWRDACTAADTFTGFMVPLLTQHSGFMVPRAPRVFAFQHRSIQEYLAGRLLAEGNAADGTRESEWTELRRFVRNPQHLIQWREVTWHALAHLQLIDSAAFLRLVAESLVEEASTARPFPVTLLLLLEVAPTLPRAADPRFVGMLVSTMLRVFVEQAPLREPLWPAFGAALLALPAEPVSTVLTEALREVTPGMAAGVAEIVLRLGAVRPLMAWMSAALVSRLIRARHLDSDELGWPIHRCLARVLTAWEGAAALEQVPELRADEARAALARPECQAALLADGEFARRMLALTGCIDNRESAYLGEYIAFARFLSLDESVRDAWLPFLQDYWGEDDSIYGIAVHMDMDFAHAVAGAAVPPSLNWQYALSVNPRVTRLVAAGAAGRPARLRTRLEAVGTWVMRMSNEERYLMLIAESGAEASGLGMQAGNDRLVRLLRQRVALLDDGIYRGVQPLLALVRRAGEGDGKSNGEAALLHAAFKAVVRALGSGGMRTGDEETFRQPYLYYVQDGAALAEWWVFACNGLVTGDFRGDDWVERHEPLLEWFGVLRREGINWLFALLEVSTAGALAHRRSHSRVPVEVLYPHLPERYGGDLPYHALTVFTLLPWETRPLTRRLADVLLEQLEAAFPAAAAECRAVRWILEGPVPGSDAGWADPSLAGFEARVPETAAEIQSPYHRARFLVRMLPYVPADAREAVRATLSAALAEVADPTARLLVAEPLHRATLELFHRGRAGEDEVAEAERAWGEALDAVTDPVHRTLGAARAALMLAGARRSALIRHAVECAAGIQDTVALAGVLREVRPVAELDPVAWKAFTRLVRTVKSSAWRQWALGRDSGVLSWLGQQVEPGGTEFVAFAALHTRVLLQEALLAMDADHGPNAEGLWMRCLRGEVPVGALVARGRLESYDLTPVLALALDELLQRDTGEEAAELLPLCVNPGPQALPVASRWAAHPDPRVARHGRLLCAEILGYVPERWLGAWGELLDDPDDRTRFRAGQCIRHPLVVPRVRRQRLSRLGLPYLLAWDDAVQAHKARGGPLANEMGWLTHDFVVDSKAGLQALIDQARDDSAGARARRLLRGFEMVDEGSRQSLVQTLRVETDPEMQHCLLGIVFRAVHRGTLVRARLDAVRETLRAPVLAAVCDRRFFIPATADYLAVFGALWEAGRGAPVSRAAFVEAMEARCGLRLADLEERPVEEFVSACDRIALSHFFCDTGIIGYLSRQVETRWAVAGLEFFLQWFCDEAPMESRPTDLQGDHRDHLLLVAAGISASIPSLIRGNVRLPAALEPRLRQAVMKGTWWAERMAALELLGSIASAGPELLDCLVRGVVDTAAVRTTAFRVAARMRDVDGDFIERVIPRLHDESGIVAYAMGRVLKNAFLHSETTPEARERIIQALTLAKDSASARRTVYFEHHSRINLPHLPRLDQHFARLVGEIWLGDQAPTLQRSRSGWERPPPDPPAETPPVAKPAAATGDG